MCSTMAHPPDSVWRWLTRIESRRSFHRTGMPMKKGLAMPGGRSGNTGPSQHRRIERYIRKNILTLEGTRWQYTHGVGDPESVPPESYTLDTALLERPGNKDIQLDLFLDYASNVKLYPAFQDYFRKAKPPLLAIWGKNDPFFVPAGRRHFAKTCRMRGSSSWIPGISLLRRTPSKSRPRWKTVLLSKRTGHRTGPMTGS